MDADQLRHVESLCDALYVGTSANERAEAQEQLLTLQSSAECIPQCQFILDNSSQPYAQLLASASLEALLTQYWNNFDQDQKLEIRNYILNFLANNAHSLQDFVTGSMAKLACRITKLGWFDNIEHREIVDEVTKFLQGTVDHHLVGLKILHALVDEMNIPTTGRTLTTHRKTAVSFRDNSLFQVFQIGLTTLRHIHTRSIPNITPDQEKRMTASALSLATSCLSFDFIGTNPEESPEDVGTVQVPSSWRPIVQDTLTMQLFFDFYLNTEPPRSSQALEAIVQLSSVRRSLFAVEKERTVFLDHLMKNIQEIMHSKMGLEHAENYHEFCRLLGRLKASYQLSELVKTRGFSDWLGLAAEFTVASLQNWQYSMNSIHYLLALWSRLVAALPYLRPDASDGQLYAQILRQCVFQVVESYIDTMLGSVEVVVDGDGFVDDPLEDEGALKEQMDKLPTLIRLQFEEIAQYLLNIFENDMALYEQALSGQGGPLAVRQINILEGRLTWLVQMVAAVIGSQSSSADTSKAGGHDQIWDGQLSRFVFQLVQALDFRMGNTSGRAKCDEKLELALLTYFKAFKRAYLMDVGAMGASVSSPLGMGGVVPPGGRQAHPLLSLALSYGSEAKDSGMEDTSGNVRFPLSDCFIFNVNECAGV
jgi:exportin-7